MATDGKQRRVVTNSEAQWVRHADESLRIVSDDLWAAVKRRQDEQHRRAGERVACGIETARARHTGRVWRHLSSGLLRCSECGGNYTLLNNRAYDCAGYLNARICSNNRSVKRETLERVLLADIKAGLQSEDVLREVERRLRQALRSRKRDDGTGNVAKLEAEIANIVSAVAQGLLSPALRQRLQEAESELALFKGAPKPASVETLLAQLPGIIRKHASTIERFAQHDPVRARAAVRQALESDSIVLRPAQHGRHVIAEFGIAPVAVAAGAVAESVVTGA